MTQPTITLHLGDCLNYMQSMKDKSVDLCLTDPPYGHNNNNGDLISVWEAALGKGESPKENYRPIANDGIEANEIYKQCLPEWNRLLRNGGCCCCCGGGGPDPQFARWSLWMDEVFDFKQMVIWDKGPMGMGWHYRRSYETVLVGVKRGGSCKWYDESQKIENIIRHIPKIIPQANEHPTVKPIELMSHFIKLHTQAGDTVFDPFMGSGTTGVAAKILRRSFVGCEIDPTYFALVKHRIDATEWGLPFKE
jgi:DNA modification methylase